ncbi:unnamed protein product [Linum trigynum]|uniref:Uncharacterized protein n=1 Tax=Linum trigynum TaxID=586398 RepID=A0AAV2F789_9ROSI
MASREHLIEFGMGFVNSRLKFPLDHPARPGCRRISGVSARVPGEGRRDRVYLRLVPQEEVLNHPSVGFFFLRTAGGGSMLERLTAGVPVMCWPFFGDQLGLPVRSGGLEWRSRRM